MSTALQLGIVAGYLLIALGVGLFAYRLTDRTAEDYYLASRTLGTVVLLFTTFATLLSAFTFFAGPNIAYGNGPEWILVMGLMDGVLFGILWYVIGYKQWLVGRARGYVTLGEMLGDRFGSRTLRGLVAGVSLFWLFPYVMLQQVGAGTALAALTDGAVSYAAGAGIITAFMIAYVVLAGMRGIAWTDTLQGVFMLTVVWAATLWVLSAVGGVGEATGALAANEPGFLSLGGGLYSPEWMISQAVTIAFGVTMFPQVNQRFFVARSEAVLKRSFALWPVLVILLFVPAFMLGAWAAGLGVAMPESGNILPALLTEYTPGWFAALVVAGAMAAMMSSSDSMLLSGSSYFTRDLYRPFAGGDVDERREDLIARVGVVAFAVAAFLVSLTRPATLFAIGDAAFSGFAQLALPVAVALYWRRTTRTGIAAGILGSQGFYALHLFWIGTSPAAYGGWTAGVVGMVVGLVLTVGVSAVTAAAPDEDESVYFGSAGAD
ncbi:sodium:solute symporter family protein [Halostella litorea]|uniref:sodium:solute symporter family protein n=1 Tax=Halostella litorea TaxID=2528831 RepID=UPI0010919D9F|nr:sodium:solute symporter family protein [Halostella litorea]